MRDKFFRVRKAVRGGLLLEGIVALAVAFTVGFALSGSLLNARKLLTQGQEAQLAQDVLQIALVQARTQTTGSQTLNGHVFNWKAVQRQQPAFTEVEVTVFWVDNRQRSHQLSNSRIYRKADADS